MLKRSLGYSGSGKFDARVEASPSPETSVGSGGLKHEELSGVWISFVEGRTPAKGASDMGEVAIV
jgi:hypothetical protein